MEYRAGPAPTWLVGHHKHILGFTAEHAVALVEQAGVQARVLLPGHSMLAEDPRSDSINLWLVDARLVESTTAS